MNTDARDIRIDDYTYDLADERIARHPLPDRADAKLLHYRGGDVTQYRFRDIPSLLPSSTLLIGNQTRVIHARLHFPVGTAGRNVEIFLLEPLAPSDYALSLGSGDAVVWKCLVGGNRRWKSGPLSIDVDGSRLWVERGPRRENSFEVTFRWDGDRSFGELIEAAGDIPLPPYLGREAEDDDRLRYQTVFARQEGSVAAPTAGLHFTPEILQRLQERDVDWRTLTLHVGAGTFKPVSSQTLGGHTMHREFFSVTRKFLQQLHTALVTGRPVVSVGTTSMRCLESLFYFGAICALGEPLPAALDQWVAGSHRYTRVDAAPALAALIDHVGKGGSDTFEAYTHLLLTPAVKPRVVDGLITNFHQPRSTLLLLVASMIGQDWRRVYAYALGHDFRFLSFGDSSLLWRRGAGAE